MFTSKNNTDKILQKWENQKFNLANKNEVLESFHALLNDNPGDIDQIFQAWFNLVDKLGNNSKANYERFYHFTKILFSNKYIPRYHKHGVNYRELEYVVPNFRSEWIKAIKKLLTLENIQIVPKKNESANGKLGNVASLPFCLYNSSIRYDKQDQYFSDLSPFVFDFVQRFPDSFHYSISNILQYHEKPIEEVAKILKYCIENNILDNEFNAFQSLMNNIVSPFSTSDFYHKNGVKILSIVHENSNNWTINQLEDYLVKGIYKAFHLDFTPKEEKIASCLEYLDFLEKNKEKEHYDFSVKYTQKRLKEFQEKSYSVIGSSDWIKAYKKIATTPKLKQILTQIIKVFKSRYDLTVIEKLIKDAEDFKKAPKLFPLNNKPETVFKDLHFKLFVIEELMYKQEILKPKFEISKLAEEHTKRQISIEDDGYQPIPEALKYFKNLNISHEDLQKVETVYIDDGLMGGTKIYKEFWPFFDPGCGDELLPVKSKVIEDLNLLPNLKKVIGLELLNPIKKVIKAFENRDIERINLDDYTA